MKKGTAIALLLLAFVIHSKGQSYLWSKGVGGTGQNIGYGVDNDGINNVYLTGCFTGTVDFGGGGLTSGGNDDIFLIKYDPFGNHIFSQKYGGPGVQIGHDVEVSPSGQEVYIVGFFEDSLCFGEQQTIYGIGDKDAFVAKLDSVGGLIWAKAITGNSDIVANAIAIDQNENIYVTGYFKNSFIHNLVSYSSAGGKDAFLLKYDSNGNDMGRSISADNKGDIHATGSMAWITSGKDETLIYNLERREKSSDFDDEQSILKTYLDPQAKILTLWIEVPPNDLGNISLFDFQGRKVYEMSVSSSGSYQINTWSFSKGNYALKYQNIEKGISQNIYIY